MQNQDDNSSTAGNEASTTGHGESVHNLERAFAVPNNVNLKHIISNQESTIENQDKIIESQNSVMSELRHKAKDDAFRSDIHKLEKESLLHHVAQVKDRFKRERQDTQKTVNKLIHEQHRVLDKAISENELLKRGLKRQRVELIGIRSQARSLTSRMDDLICSD